VDGYRRAREALKELSLDADPTQFHLWRKRVKDHWYHLTLFEQLHSTPRSRARTLDRLESLLGDDHDLAMLRALILAAPDRYGGARATTLVLGSITKRSAMLRKRALALGQRTFAKGAKEFDDAVVSWWRER
jgi:CHAD domain-containing protein